MVKLASKARGWHQITCYFFVKSFNKYTYLLLRKRLQRNLNWSVTRFFVGIIQGVLKRSDVAGDVLHTELLVSNNYLGDFRSPTYLVICAIFCPSIVWPTYGRNVNLIDEDICNYMFLLSLSVFFCPEFACFCQIGKQWM